MRTGVLLMAFGGPDSLESVGPFMRRFMGREPSPHAVASAQERYRAIGGSSPLPGVAAQIGVALEGHLLAHGYDVVVRAGMRYWEPSIGSALEDLQARGAERLVIVSLSAFESQVTCESFRACALLAAQDLGIEDVREARLLHQAPQYRAFFGEACARALESIEADRPLVVMTAHSLPVADLVPGDPYAGGLREVAAVVAAMAGLADGADFSDDERLPGVSAFGSLEGPVAWLQGYQSKGARPGEWLGPELADVMAVAAKNGYDAVVVAPIGFAIDHMETLWDLDIDARTQAEEQGLLFMRTRVPNSDQRFIEALTWAVAPLLSARSGPD